MALSDTFFILGLWADSAEELDDDLSAGLGLDDGGGGGMIGVIPACIFRRSCVSSIRPNSTVPRSFFVFWGRA